MFFFYTFQMAPTWSLTSLPATAICGHVGPIWNVKNHNVIFLKLSENDLVLA